MSKKRSQPVAPIKDKRTGTLFVGTITAEQQRKMQRAQDRQERIDSGVRQTGSGVHGGDKKQINRRERKHWRQDLKSNY